MKQNIQLFQRSSSLWEKFLDSNPQLFRELKGKLKTRNVIIAAAVSIITQFVIAIALLGDLPDIDSEGKINTIYGRYGMGFANGYHDILAYTQDMSGNWIINWQLLWLDLFIALSIISIMALTIAGTYMLVADLVKEEDRGTFNFIRLTPQSAGNILLGKILGVPILLYITVLMFFPLHLVSGLGASIPLTSIVGFDAIIVASCGFYYSLALLWSLINLGSSGFKPWLATGAVCLFAILTTTALFHNSYLISNTLWDWLYLFNPTIVLSYLIDATYLPVHKIDFLPATSLGELSFYGQALWTKASLGMGFILFNFSLATYWIWSVLKRRFHNQDRTLFSKTQSYWITSWFTAIALGFTLQNHSPSKTGNFIILQCSLYVLGLVSIAALSPHRQALHDWARYRHQVSKNGKVLWKELIFGENSPAVVAVAINMAIAVIYIIPSVFIILDRDAAHICGGLILGANSIVFCASIAQLVLTMKTRKRAVWSAFSVFAVTIVPPLCLGIAEIYPDTTPQLWLFSFIPTITTEYATLSGIFLAIVGQCIAISTLGFIMTKKLNQAGKSETKILFERTKAISR